MMKSLEKYISANLSKYHPTTVLFEGEWLEWKECTRWFLSSHSRFLVPKRLWNLQQQPRLQEGFAPFKPGTAELELKSWGEGGRESEFSPYHTQGCIATPSGARRGEWGWINIRCKCTEHKRMKLAMTNSSSHKSVFTKWNKNQVGLSNMEGARLFQE